MFAFDDKLQKENTEGYIEYLMKIGWLDEAGNRLVDIINDDSFVSREGKSKHQVGVAGKVCLQYVRYLMFV
jgi:hypothetical protein